MQTCEVFIWNFEPIKMRQVEQTFQGTWKTEWVLGYHSISQEFGGKYKQSGGVWTDGDKNALQIFRDLFLLCFVSFSVAQE